MPKVSRPAGPRVVEPAKPEDRFGRDDEREPDLFAALTPAPRPPRSNPPEAPARPKSPSSLLARANEQAKLDEVDLDVPTFDRRGVRPSFDAAGDDQRAAAERDDRPSRRDANGPTATPVARDLASDGFDPDEHEPSIFDSGLGLPVAKPQDVPVSAERPAERASEPPRVSAPARSAAPPAVQDTDADDDFPFHSSSADPNALDTIAYLTNELAGHIAAFDERATSARETRDTAVGAADREDARTWVDVADTQIDDPDIARLRREADAFDLDLEAAPAQAAETERGRAAEPAIVVPATAHASEPAVIDADEADHPMPRGPAIATFVIERVAPAPAEREAPEARERAADGAARGGERVAIDWDELRAARARDWDAFEAGSAPRIAETARPAEPEREPVVEPRRRVARPIETFAEAGIQPPRAASASRVEPVSNLAAEAPRVRPPQPAVEARATPPARWLDAESPRVARHGWNEVTEPDLLDEMDDAVDGHVETQEELAPFTARSLAFAIDIAIVASTAIVAVLLGVIAFGATEYQRIDFVHSFGVLDDAFNYLLVLIGVVYFTASHAWTGATLGKALLGLQVLRADRSGPPNIGWSLARTAMYLPSSILGLGFLWALKGPRRAWHDLVARTVVVRTHPPDPG
ncbi:MAG: RDD family protein [bacterium]